MENISSLKHGFQSPFNMGRPFKVGMEEKLSWRETFCTLMPPPYMFASTKASTRKKNTKVQNAKCMKNYAQYIFMGGPPAAAGLVRTDHEGFPLYLLVFVFMYFCICAMKYL